MILDYTNRVNHYGAILPLFQEAMAFAQTLIDAPVGRYDQGDCFFLVQEFQTALASDKDFELHRNYADVHVVLEGREQLGYQDIDFLSPKKDYNAKHDIQMLSGQGQDVVIEPGMFCLVLPHDGHKPGCCVDAPAALRKIVVKIPV